MKTQGINRSWHSNGQLFFEGRFNNGKREGLHKWWDKKGRLLSEGEFKGDKEIGIQKSYNVRTGKLTKKGQFVDGKIVTSLSN
jgi:antitoxin component YwqK of YwqJK toxin-antitoxin module